MDKHSSRFTLIDDSDPSCQETWAALFIYHIDPKLVTEKLGLAPTHYLSKGTATMLPSGTKMIEEIDSWSFSSLKNVESKDTRTHLNWVLDRIMPVTQQLLELQTIAGVKTRMYCVWFSSQGGGGPALWPEQMEKMASLNLECDFSFIDYCEED